MNATKYGLYSSRVVVEVGDGKEDGAEWEALLRGVIASYSPVGDHEHLLVGRIAFCHWRHLRAARSETGDIRRLSDNALHAQQQSIKKQALASIQVGEWSENSVAISLVAETLEDAKRLAESGQEIPPDQLTALGGIRGQFEVGDPIPTCIALNALWKTAKSRSPEEGKKAQQKLVDSLAIAVKFCRGLLPEQIERERRFAEANLQGTCIPHPLLLDGRLRYEGSVDKQLARPQAELEAAQRRRKGRSTSSPVPIDGPEKV